MSFDEAGLFFASCESEPEPRFRARGVVAVKYQRQPPLGCCDPLRAAFLQASRFGGGVDDNGKEPTI
ncbi:hypothetical protein FOXB_05452 [Fusarium oxysporum f. sp. conglutinans Fo5176]|uniref:Uncharacterized protein n=1 Tax=Fusarium oxysporum (strain Fo5176) TaxID=660025 RepID=F9FG94_FUSOF|nr:hypothetical protein FOXB_05452 [Fusarium oxysporum f. sp. conglutinans Fo5176]